MSVFRFILKSHKLVPYVGVQHEKNHWFKIIPEMVSTWSNSLCVHRAEFRTVQRDAYPMWSLTGYFKPIARLRATKQHSTYPG